MPNRSRKKDLSAYSSAEHVAAQLERIAADIRRGGGLVRYSVQFWFHENLQGRAMSAEHSEPADGRGLID